MPKQIPSAKYETFLRTVKCNAKRSTDDHDGRLIADGMTALLDKKEELKGIEKMVKNAIKSRVKIIDDELKALRLANKNKTKDVLVDCEVVIDSRQGIVLIVRELGTHEIVRGPRPLTTQEREVFNATKSQPDLYPDDAVGVNEVLAKKLNLLEYVSEQPANDIGERVRRAMDTADLPEDVKAAILALDDEEDGLGSGKKGKGSKEPKAPKEPKAKRPKKGAFTDPTGVAPPVVVAANDAVVADDDEPGPAVVEKDPPAAPYEIVPMAPPEEGGADVAEGSDAAEDDQSDSDESAEDDAGALDAAEASDPEGLEDAGEEDAPAETLDGTEDEAEGDDVAGTEDATSDAESGTAEPLLTDEGDDGEPALDDAPVGDPGGDDSLDAPEVTSDGAEDATDPPDVDPYPEAVSAEDLEGEDDLPWVDGDNASRIPEDDAPARPTPAAPIVATEPEESTAPAGDGAGLDAGPSLPDADVLGEESDPAPVPPPAPVAAPAPTNDVAAVSDAGKLKARKKVGKGATPPAAPAPVVPPPAPVAAPTPKDAGPPAVGASLTRANSFGVSPKILANLEKGILEVMAGGQIPLITRDGCVETVERSSKMRYSDPMRAALPHLLSALKDEGKLRSRELHGDIAYWAPEQQATAEKMMSAAIARKAK